MEKSLAYKTRGNSSPQGKERVFFACHPEDFSNYFEPICEEIFKTQNCAVWYDEKPEIAWNPEEMDTELGRMQLFVIPITSRFLYKGNSAREVLFRFAVEHHIPVLPLMQERGLEEGFNRICGDLQFLDKNAARSDPTALPYDQKLERFLASVLLGDELAEKVRKAFDAYIFLSYRKKDRKYAQELMRLIHQNDFCRDIAIWYDEFLVPGENFNHAIQEAMEKSELFAFVVTPNLLEPDNYVMKEEYPAAKENGKPILPAEMATTDRQALLESYSEIPEPVDAHNAPVLSKALMQGLCNLAIAERNDESEHLFFIGLAYLSGIDVEENREQGVQLITTAAERELPEAMEKLSQMYKSGEGVERDYEVSARWLEKLADYWEKKFTESGSQEDGVRWWSVLARLGVVWCEQRKLEVAVHACNRLLAVSERMLEQFPSRYNKNLLGFSYDMLGHIYTEKGNFGDARVWHEKALEINEGISRETGTEASQLALSISYNRLGNICEKEGNPGGARVWYEKALEIREELRRETGTVKSRRNLSGSYERMGDICKVEGNPGEAKIWYEKALEIREELRRETGSVESRRNLSVSYIKLGDICEEERNLREARAWYEKALEIDEDLRRETGSVESRRDLSVNYGRLGNICKAEGNLRGAKARYEKAMKIDEDLRHETGSVESRQDLSISYSRLGDICEEEGNLGGARAWHEKAMEIRKELSCETGTKESRRDLSVSYIKLGDICKAEGNLGEAGARYEKAMEIRKELNCETGTAEARRDLSVSYERMGDICKAEGNLGGSRVWHEKAMEIREELSCETGSVESRRDLSVSYSNLGDICKAEGNLGGARVWHEKAMEISEELSREMGTMELYNDLAVSYYNLGMLDPNKPDINLLRNARKIWQRLSKQYAMIPMFRQYRQYADVVIAIAEEQKNPE